MKYRKFHNGKRLLIGKPFEENQNWALTKFLSHTNKKRRGNRPQRILLVTNRKTRYVRDTLWGNQKHGIQSARGGSCKVDSVVDNGPKDTRGQEEEEVSWDMLRDPRCLPVSNTVTDPCSAFLALKDRHTQMPSCTGVFSFLPFILGTGIPFEALILEPWKCWGFIPRHHLCTWCVLGYKAWRTASAFSQSL